jgi:hypothetical protein
MGKMLDLIRECKAPAAMVQKAARGRLALPLWERLEVLVFLATSEDYQGTMLSDDARLALTSLDTEDLISAFAAPELPFRVAAFYLRKRSLDPRLAAALASNTAVEERLLTSFAQLCDLQQRAALLSCERVQSSARLMVAVCGKKTMEAERPAAELAGEFADDDVLQFLSENAAELGSEAADLELRGEAEDEDELFDLILKACTFDEYSPDGMDEAKRLSLIQKISSLRTGDRVKLALRGNREVRTLLIRDTSRLVCLAVIDSPKVSDTEIESYAAMTGLQECVLRGIASRRRYMKHYNVVKLLTSNPKMPLDVSLKLLPHILDPDLKRIIKDKNLPDTLRKVGFKLWRDRNTRK